MKLLLFMILLFHIVDAKLDCFVEDAGRVNSCCGDQALECTGLDSCLATEGNYTCQFNGLWLLALPFAITVGAVALYVVYVLFMWLLLGAQMLRGRDPFRLPRDLDF